MVEVARVAILALLSILPHSPAEPGIRSRLTEIATTAADASRAHDVPLPVLLSVGWHESWLGVHPQSGGCWGAPRDFRHRGLAGTADDAARVLANGRRACGSWPGAVGWFRSGRCDAGTHAGYVRSVTGLASRLH